jgi:hypothetical protein
MCSRKRRSADRLYYILEETAVGNGAQAVLGEVPCVDGWHCSLMECLADGAVIDCWSGAAGEHADEVTEDEVGTDYA